MERLGGRDSFQAISIRGDTLNKCDLLRQVAHFIIANKNHLPDDVRLSLSNAFGRENRSSDNRPTRSRANDARNRIEQVREINVMPSSEMLSSIEEIRQSPSTFWSAGLSVKVDWDASVLRHIYHGNRQHDKLAVTYRAFYTTATYLFIRSICEAFQVKKLTDRVLRYCIALVDPDRAEDPELVKQNLKDDYRAGLVWHTYSEHLGGYGAFFLIGVAPTWIFEVSLNQNDDLRFAVSHFKSIQVPEIAAQYSLHGLGSDIISEITQNVGRFLPRNRDFGKRKYKITKPINSNYSKTAKTCARVPENRMASLENGAFQDNHSSGVQAGMNWRQAAGQNCSISSDLRPENSSFQARTLSQESLDETAGNRDSLHSSTPRDDPLSASEPVGQVASESTTRTFSTQSTEEHATSGNAFPPIYNQNIFNPHGAPDQGRMISDPGLAAEYSDVRSHQMTGAPSSSSPSFEPAEQDNGMGSPKSAPPIRESATFDTTASNAQAIGDISNQLAIADQPLGLNDLRFESEAHGSHRLHDRPNAQSETSTSQTHAFSTSCSMNAIDGTDNNYIPPCYRNEPDTLTPCNYDGSGQVENSHQPSGQVHNGFLDVSEAFRGFPAQDGFDDTTQAMNCLAWGASFMVGPDTGRIYPVGSLQGMDQVNGASVADHRNALDGYHSVSQAVEPLTFNGFSDATLAIQESRYTSNLDS